MKKKLLLHQLIFSILVTAFALQPLSVSALTVADVKEYYAQFTRGAQCFFQRKKCSDQDQKAWRIGSSGILVAILAIVGYTQKGRIASLIAGRPAQPAKSEEHIMAEERLKKSLEQQQLQKKKPRTYFSTNDHPMLKAIIDNDVLAVKKLAKNPENLQITAWGDSLLRFAVDHAFAHTPDEPQSMEMVKILLDNNARHYEQGNTAQQYLDRLNNAGDLSKELQMTLQEMNALFNPVSLSSPLVADVLIPQIRDEPVRVYSTHHPMPIAIYNRDIKGLKKLATDPKNLQIKYAKRGLTGEFNPLSDAVDRALENPEDEKRVEVVQVLLANGALKYDYDNQAQKIMNEMNNAISQLTGEQTRSTYQDVIKAVEEINKMWTQYKP